MTLDRTLAVLGLVVSVFGALIALNLDPLGWAVFIAGIGVLTFAAWRSHRAPDFTPLWRWQEFIFLDPLGEVVQVTRTASYRVNKSGLTAIPIQAIQGTGPLVDFNCNLGRVEVSGGGGGGKEVLLVLETPIRRGAIITPVLRYRGLNCFESARESVSHGGLKRWTTACLTVEFHPDRFPGVVHAVVQSGSGPEEEVESWYVSSTLPRITWFFHPRRRRKYLLKWTWPSGSKSDHPKPVG